MLTRILPALLAILVLASPAIPAWAQAPAPDESRIVPDTREQVQLSFAPLVKKISPAVVNIYTKREVAVRNAFLDDPFFTPFFEDRQFGGRMRKQVEGALGSGVIVDAGGLIVTNSHVIRGAQQITVVLNDGREFEATLALQDDASDVSLLRIDTKGEKLPFATLKPSESLEVGDLVLAIGNPFGVGQTVTSGIVSALARSSLNINDFNFFIQTDAAINPGNSGGPLVALDGGVVGINAAIYSRDGGSLGIGFAIPSEMVANVIAAEKAGVDKTRGIIRPWLGVTAQGVTSDIASSMNLGKPGGALIAGLQAASPLSKAGMRVGDVVTKINGHDIHDPSEMKFRMATVPIGEKATFEFIQKGETKTVEVEAMPAPDVPPRNEKTLSGQIILDGVTVATINPAVAFELGLAGDDEEEGVVVLRVDENKQGSRVVSPGDILVRINGVDIKTTADVEKGLKASARGISLVIRSQGRLRQIVIR